MVAAAGMWLQITMVLAALVSSRKSPYKLAADNRQEQMSFLGLSLVLSITSSGVPYSGGWTYWHAFLIGANAANLLSINAPVFERCRHVDFA
jgi:hypothetical protein